MATAAAQLSAERGVPVIHRGQEVVRISRGVGAIGPAERARFTSQRLSRLVRDLDFDPALVTVTDRETYSELVHGDTVMGIITDEDAMAVGRPRAEYAREVRDRLVHIIRTTREEFSTWSIAIGLAWRRLPPRSSRVCYGCSHAFVVGSTRVSKGGSRG